MKNIKKYPFILIGILIFILPFINNNINFHHVMIIFLMYAGLGEAWNIITGFTGQTSFGHAAFFGIGAYTSTMLFYKYQISPWFGMIFGIVLSVVVAGLVSYPCFKLKGHYFAIATMAIGEIIKQLFVSWDYVEGATGIMIPIVDESLVSYQFHSSKLPYFIIVFILFAITFLLARYIENNKMGFYLKAIRESAEAAESIGIDTTRYKLYAMIISAGLAAAFGTFYAQYILYIDPFMVFDLDISMKIVLLTVLGGIGNVYGPVIGAAILVPLSEYTRIQLGGTGKGIDLMIFGALIVIVACLEPQGILGIFKRKPKKRGAEYVQADA